jgi:cytochrome c oxidase subunit III
MTSGPELNVERLPTYGFGSRTPMFWGTLSFILLEGTGFALAIGSYLYLMHVNQDWPINTAPPSLGPGTLVTAIMVLSAVPNHLLKNWARQQNLPLVRWGMVGMTLIGFVLLVIRIFEFPALNTTWDTNAYGSIIWFLLGLHTVHLLTDVGDTLVLAVLMFTHHAHSGKRFSDVEDNAVYWDFVWLSWLVIYLVIYWLPRW